MTPEQNWERLANDLEAIFSDEELSYLWWLMNEMTP